MSGTNLDQLIDVMEKLKMSLENDTNYAVIWLGECIDFLQNGDLQMAVWAYGQYLNVMERVDLESYKKTGEILQQQLQKLIEK